MSKKQVVRILPSGEMQFIDKPELAELKAQGPSSSRRASHVEPHNRLLRAAFHLLRRTFGERGAVAAFTRGWPCRWRVNMTLSGGDVFKGVYHNRQDAIDAEVLWLQDNKLGAPQPTYECPVCKKTGPREVFEAVLDEIHCPDCYCPYLKGPYEPTDPASP